MNLIDIRTLILNQTISYAICLIVIASLWQQNRRRFAGLGHWLTGFILLTMGMVLIMLRGVIPLWISTVFGGNVFFLGGALLLLIGLEQFVGLRSRQLHNYMLLVVSAGIHGYFTIIQPNLAARNINISISLLLITTQIAWLMLRRTDPEMRPMTRTIGYIAVAFGVVSIARVMVNTTLPPDNDFFKGTGTIDALLLLGYQVLFFATTFSLFFLINQNQFLELQNQQSALRESEGRYRRLFEFSPDAIVVHQEGIIVFANPAAVNMVRAANAADLLGKRIIDFIHPDYQNIALKRINEALVLGKNAPLIEEKFIRLDGTSMDVEVTTSPLEDGGRPALQTIVREITERKRADEVLRLRLELFEFAAEHSLEELLQQALDEIGEITSSPVGFYHFIEADQKTISLQAWSTRTQEEFCQAEGKGRHYDLDEAGVWVDCVRQRKPVIHNDYAALPHRKGLPPGHAAVRRELVVPTMRDDKIVSILGVGNKPSEYDERDIELVSYVSDVIWSIIERKRAETQLRTYQHQLETQNLELRKLSLAIEQSGNSVIITDAHGVIQYANPRFEQTSGYTLVEAEGKTPRILKSGKQDAAFYQDLWQTINSGQIWRGEFHNRRKDGSHYWESATIAPVHDAAGQITNYIAIKEEITRRKRMEADLERLATTDSLTGAFNRRQMTKIANQELHRAVRYGHPTSVILLDIDDFKEINDHFGHAAGDLAIQETAKTILINLRTIDYLGRYGGDEFVIVLPETDQNQAEQVAERLRSKVDRHEISHDAQDVDLSISLGLVCVAGDTDQDRLDFDRLTQLADRALYIAKESGRNCVRVYNNGCGEQKKG